MTYGGQVTDPTAYIYIYIYFFIVNKKWKQRERERERLRGTQRDLAKLREIERERILNERN